MKLALKPDNMDMDWPGDTLIVSNVARKAKRVAHPWSSHLTQNVTVGEGGVWAFNT